MELNATIRDERGGPNMTAWTLTIPAFIAVVILLYWRLLPSSLDPREPPLVTSKIPFIGHAIGMLRKQQRYLEALRYVEFM
jgi:hypothetical protein